MIKRIFLLLFFVLVISQFLRPDKNQGSYDSIATFEAAAEAPVEVKTILQSNCYDCHSNTTRYPWFMEVSPLLRIGCPIRLMREKNILMYQNGTPIQTNKKIIS
ncbi:heme-binding domain-containing protein [Aquimarina algiphila]|uniref:heme-binding domain-containing protein n=1 Tax=Aquimarina algiphila TaxID=2047982 RepID=UPI0024907815|nr:heme-binding domain-containing protein [Aquimarina algiphila]